MGIAVKRLTDIFGFILIGSATLYIAYQKAMYKGPRFRTASHSSCLINAEAPKTFTVILDETRSSN